ncbi:MAG: universal stress protein [Chloroflexota bacterium]
MKRFFIPLDGSAFAQQAARVAAAVARNKDHELIFMHAHWPGLRPLDSDGFIPNIELTLGDAARRVHMEYRVTPSDDLTGQVVLDAAYDCGADLVIMASHGQGGLGRHLYGRVADQVLQSTRLPVLLVPASLPRRWPRVAPPSVVLALDESESSERAIEPTIAITELLHADLVLVRAIWEWDPGTAQYERALGRAERYLRGVIARIARPALRMRWECRWGDPDQVIVDVARDVGAVALGMGTSGQGGRHGRTLGSIALGTVRRTDVPVLLVPPADHLRLPPLSHLLDGVSLSRSPALLPGR